MSFCVRVFVCSMSMSVDKITDWIGKGFTTMSTYDKNTMCVTSVGLCGYTAVPLFFMLLHVRVVVHVKGANVDVGTKQISRYMVQDSIKN